MGAPAVKEEPKAQQKKEDNKPKLFKGSSTNPFAKRTGGSTSGGIGVGGGSSGNGAGSGLFYPSQTAGGQMGGAQTSGAGNQFTSVTSFGAKNTA